MASLSSNYRDGKGRNAERHERIRKAELAIKAEQDAEDARRAEAADPLFRELRQARLLSERGYRESD